MRSSFFTWAFLLVSFGGIAQADEEFQARVVNITDGDTVVVLRDRKEIRVRLHGIDAPEKGQDFGSRARSALGDLVAGETVTVQAHEKDKYGRTVATLVLKDGRNVNHLMVQDGMAWWYRKYAPKDHELEDLEAKARTAGRGLWAMKAPVPPWEFRSNKKTKARQ
jgi:endonuclease YncB( thermonuclease family)